MTKEEYAELCYLLGKLKYCFAESAIESNYLMKCCDKISSSINDILTSMIIINNKKED